MSDITASDLKAAEIERLQELLRAVGANRSYWEGRWRDSEAENARLRAVIERLRAALQHEEKIIGLGWQDLPKP